MTVKKSASIDTWLTRSAWTVPLLLLVAALLVFGHGLKNEFVLDDHIQIVENPVIRSLASIPSLLSGSTIYAGTSSLQGIFYRPLMMILFTVINVLFGTTPFPFHLLQLLLHTLNGYLVYRLFVKKLPVTVSFLSALIFIIHPLNIEAVVYVSNLQDVLFACCGLLALNILQSGLAQNRRMYWSLGFLFLGLMAKETALLFIVLASVWVFLNVRRFFWKYMFGSTIVIGAYAMMRFHAVGTPAIDRVIPIAAASPVERLLTLPQVLWYYISHFFFPYHLAIGQFWVIRQFTFGDVMLPLILVITFGYLMIDVILRLSRKQSANQPLYFMLGLWLAGGLALHSHIFPLDATVNDRWFYAVSIPFIVLTLLTVNDFIRNRSNKQLAAGTIVILLIARSFVRVGDWSTGFRLFTHDSQYSGDSFTLENNLGIEYYHRSQYEEAKAHLEKSVGLVSTWGNSWNNLGNVYDKYADISGDPSYNYKALDAYSNAIKYAAGNTPYINLARLLVKYPVKSDSDVQTFFRNVLTKYPDNRDLWYLKSEYDVAHGRYQDALTAAKRFSELYPSQVADDWLNQIELSAQRAK